MGLYRKGFLALLLLAGRGAAQEPLSERNISLEEVQVKPREPEVWVQKGTARGTGGFVARICDTNGKQMPPTRYLNRIEMQIQKTLQVIAVETGLYPFRNDSFNVFFCVMQVWGRDTTVFRKLVSGRETRRRKCLLQFAPDEVILLPQPFFMGFEVVPTGAKRNRYYHLTRVSSQDLYVQQAGGEMHRIESQNGGCAFPFKVTYREL